MHLCVSFVVLLQMSVTPLSASFRCCDPLVFFTCMTRFRQISFYCYSCSCCNFVVLFFPYDSASFMAFCRHYSWAKSKTKTRQGKANKHPSNPVLQIERVPSVPVINFGKYFISLEFVRTQANGTGTSSHHNTNTHSHTAS